MRPDAALERAARDDRAAIEARCRELVERFSSQHARMRDAILYALLDGGKRVRALLCVWTHDVLGGARRDAALDAACAVECVHAYSLVHDDLPCMDNDDFRRGKPSTHRRFGEATAVLAGDALLNLAYEILSTLVERRGVPAETALEVVRVLAGASGSEGLITGQALDLEAEITGDSAQVERIHEHKTARLMAAAMELGAVLADADSATRERIRRAGLRTGRAFQIADDLLDIGGDEQTLGKAPGEDVRQGRLTYPSVVGVERAHADARALVRDALAALPEAAETPLATLIAFVVERSS